MNNGLLANNKPLAWQFIKLVDDFRRPSLSIRKISTISYINLKTFTVSYVLHLNK